MTNKRTLKKAIKQICETLFVECFAACSSANKAQLENIDALFFSIIKLQANYTSRISHPEPGRPNPSGNREFQIDFQIEIEP